MEIFRHQRRERIVNFAGYGPADVYKFDWRKDFASYYTKDNDNKKHR